MLPNKNRGVLWAVIVCCVEDCLSGETACVGGWRWILHWRLIFWCAGEIIYALSIYYFDVLEKSAVTSYKNPSLYALSICCSINCVESVFPYTNWLPRIGEINAAWSSFTPSFSLWLIYSICCVEYLSVVSLEKLYSPLWKQPACNSTIYELQSLCETEECCVVCYVKTEECVEVCIEDWMVHWAWKLCIDQLVYEPVCWFFMWILCEYQSAAI